MLVSSLYETTEILEQPCVFNRIQFRHTKTTICRRVFEFLHVAKNRFSSGFSAFQRAGSQQKYSCRQWSSHHPSVSMAAHSHKVPTNCACQWLKKVHWDATWEISTNFECWMQLTSVKKIQFLGVWNVLEKPEKNRQKGSVAAEIKKNNSFIGMSGDTSGIFSCKDSGLIDTLMRWAVLGCVAGTTKALSVPLKPSTVLRRIWNREPERDMINQKPWLYMDTPKGIPLFWGG